MNMLANHQAVAKAPNTMTRSIDAAPERQVSTKRRKVRKGTRSCWECKRRKIRCILTSPDDAVCLGCQQRRVTCVSQEVPETFSPAVKGNRHLSDRISRVEEALQDLLGGKDICHTNHVQAQTERDTPSVVDAPTARFDESETSTIRAASTAEAHAEPPKLPPPRSSLQSSEDQHETEEVLHHLLEAFPSENDAQILLKEGEATWRYNHLVNTQPYSKLTPETFAAPFPKIELPNQDAHPVVVAEYMLIFALTLQAPPKASFESLSEPQNILMHRLVSTARTWVMNNVEMSGSIEHLVCIMLEGVFETNCGNLRRAWAVYRKAMTAAQLMGLHRSPLPTLKRIEPDTDAEPEMIWFHIVYMDRYLSLLLGLPQGTADKMVGMASMSPNEPPLGCFERRLTVIASRILDRNENTFITNDFTTTRSIDAELLEVSQNMPSSFWRPGYFHGLTPGMPDTFLETLRLGAQVYYYGLLIQLHLPYMMQHNEHTEHEYSKIACVNASREILTRFIAHRTFNPFSSCSRPVDFWAFLAAMTLLLAHLDAAHLPRGNNFLAHLRLSDRAILDQVLERMDVLSDVNKDVMHQKSAELLRRLLDVEADASKGRTYTTEHMVGGEGGEQKKNDDLRLHIPYLGIIKIARLGAITQESRPGRTTTQSDLFQSQKRVAPNAPRVESRTHNHLKEIASNPMFSGALPTSQMPGSRFQTTAYDQSLLQQSAHDYDNTFLEPSEEFPFTDTDLDDWTFQGVDMAFFDNLMRDASFQTSACLERQ